MVAHAFGMQCFRSCLHSPPIHPLIRPVPFSAQALNGSLCHTQRFDATATSPVAPPSKRTFPVPSPSALLSVRAVLCCMSKPSPKSAVLVLASRPPAPRFNEPLSLPGLYHSRLTIAGHLKEDSHVNVTLRVRRGRGREASGGADAQWLLSSGAAAGAAAPPCLYSSSVPRLLTAFTARPGHSFSVVPSRDCCTSLACCSALGGSE